MLATGADNPKLEGTYTLMMSSERARDRKHCRTDAGRDSRHTSHVHMYIQSEELRLELNGSYPWSVEPRIGSVQRQPPIDCV
jgi:hypothetical protein